MLAADLQARSRPGLFFAGQISGVEGYTESAATGLLAGINAARLALGRPTRTLPAPTMLGALCRYISHADKKNYQPMNAAFGLLPDPPTKIRKKKERRLARAAHAIEAMTAWTAENEDLPPVEEMHG